jgi:hypothetical protein
VVPKKVSRTGSMRATGGPPRAAGAAPASDGHSGAKASAAAAWIALRRALGVRSSEVMVGEGEARKSRRLAHRLRADIAYGCSRSFTQRASPVSAPTTLKHHEAA